MTLQTEGYKFIIFLTNCVFPFWNRWYVYKH